jgi:hypothetical protein
MERGIDISLANFGVRKGFNAESAGETPRYAEEK